MPTAEKQKAIDELVEKARASLAGNSFFEAERMTLKALLMARKIDDFARMIMAAQPLQAAREGRVNSALGVSKIRLVQDPVTEATEIKRGCYLVEPPQVGADARRLRLAALQREIPVAVICREPLTKLKQCPVVAIGAGITIRVRIQPPENLEKPDKEWFIGAMEQLGDWAVQTIDPTLEVLRRIDVVLEHLDAVPEHAGLHQMLIDLCREAIEARDNAPPEPPRRRRRANLTS